ncbi:hypothetical protein [Goekera deserti]|uniref:hypothetical protein n=1 Tax=Goekera deserti TaxID=2497753 RepID=UPI001C9E3317|nr:hypothetical protein [Goekera deserti]
MVVEDRYSGLFALPHAPGVRVPEALAELQARFPQVPVTFCGTRELAEEWTCRWLGACLAELGVVHATTGLESIFAGGEVPSEPSPLRRACRRPRCGRGR